MPIRVSRLQTNSTLLVLMCLFLAAPLRAQKDAGAIVGVVHDATGALITDAKVTVTDVDRGIELTVSTNSAGRVRRQPPPNRPVPCHCGERGI
jgi:uncharacterized iron-regulated protein